LGGEKFEIFVLFCKKFNFFAPKGKNSTLPTMITRFFVIGDNSLSEWQHLTEL
jgi:hypothetical protein